MRKLVFALMAVAALAGCTNAEKGAVVGGVGGAALGTLAGGWRIVLFQNTPARLDGRPEAVAAMSNELRAVAGQQLGRSDA